MSRIAAHVVIGVLIVGVGTTPAQESTPKPAVAEVRDTSTTSGGVTTANDSSSPKNDVLHVPCSDNEGAQNSSTSPRDANDSPQPKVRTTRRWFTGAMLKTLEFVMRGVGVAATNGK